MKEKTFRPKTMQDLEEIFYNPNRQEDRRKYMQHAQNIMSEAYEIEFPKKYLKIQVKKVIEKKTNKTPDFISLDNKYSFELTSMLPPFEPTYKYDIPIDYIQKINKAIEHAEEKIYNNDERFLIIYVDSILCALFNFFNEPIKDILQKTIFMESKIKGIIFVPQPANINGMSSDDYYESMGFFKNDHSIADILFNNIKNIIYL